MSEHSYPIDEIVVKHMPLWEQIEEAKRELKVRQRVYPGWVVKEDLTPQVADHRIAAQAAIVKTLEELAEPSLFPEGS